MISAAQWEKSGTGCMCLLLYVWNRNGRDSKAELIYIQDEAGLCS